MYKCIYGFINKQFGWSDIFVFESQMIYIFDKKMWWNGVGIIRYLLMCLLWDKTFRGYLLHIKGDLLVVLKFL